jgi:hypothetical protein
MMPYIGRITSALIQLMQPHTNLTLSQNIGVTIGRLGRISPAVMADVIGETESLPTLCSYLKLGSYSDEKVEAFLGLCAMLSSRPALLLDTSSDINVSENICAFILACASWEDPPNEPLLSQLCSILETVQRTIGINLWRSLMQRFDSELQDRVRLHFRLRPS